jgi:hypothetical protein
MPPDRLFVPLSGAPWRWFASGAKLWELRRLGGRWSEKQLRPGRRVELRRGYSTPDSLWGTVAEVVRADGISAFFDAVPHGLVICAPGLGRAEAEAAAAAILGIAPAGVPVIGFRVELEAA